MYILTLNSTQTMQSLFENISDAEIKNPVILLIDASGSVRLDFNATKTIFSKMEEIVKNINATQFRVIFWNSDRASQMNNTNFPNGLLTIPYVIKKESLSQPFALARTKICDASLTFPHLVFNAIPKEWISEKDPTHIYFCTDGQIGYSSCLSSELSNLKSQLSSSITKLFKSHNNIHLHIVTVEAVAIDFNRSEILNSIAGGDVFRIIQQYSLTKYVTEFVSYTPNNENGYKHINTVIPPAGYVPFEGKIFSELKVWEFIEYLKQVVINTVSEDDLLRIIQSLSSTIKVLIKDKHFAVQNSIINTFCAVFTNTTIDPAMVQFILADTIKAENEGKAIVFSQYRSKLKDLYKQAQNLLLQNTKGALGLTSEFFTLPINDIIVTGSSQVVTETIRLGNNTYPFSSIRVNNFVVPVLPAKDGLTSLNEQCLRQFVRSIIAKQYGVDHMGDVVMYVVLGLVLKVVLSDATTEVKNAYKNLGHTMLRKKRMNTDITELSRLEDGNLPIPNNGKIEDFYIIMNTVKTVVGINSSCEPMTLWYALCLALENPEMIVKQKIHCVDSIARDFSNLNPIDLLTQFVDKFVHIQVKPMSETMLLDYTCIVTLDDCTQIGGHKFLPHGNGISKCCPTFILSNEGYNDLIAKPQIFCPVCYTTLTYEHFTVVGPKELDMEIFSSAMTYPFNSHGAITNRSSQNATTFRSNYKTVAAITAPPITIPDDKTRILVVMRGTVGCGKTTYSTAIQQKVEELGGVCINEGVDKYCRTGTQINVATERIADELRKIPTIQNDLLVVIIDTCGENDSKIMFKYDFSGWKKVVVVPNFNQPKLNEYMAWSLRNVLNRPLHTITTPYWLNPQSATTKVCIDVHLNKCKKLFGKKIQPLTESSDLITVLNQIDTAANSYQTFLDQTKPFEEELVAVYAKMGLNKFTLNPMVSTVAVI